MTVVGIQECVKPNPVNATRVGLPMLRLRRFFFTEIKFSNGFFTARSKSSFGKKRFVGMQLNTTVSRRHERGPIIIIIQNLGSGKTEINLHSSLFSVLCQPTTQLSKEEIRNLSVKTVKTSLLMCVAFVPCCSKNTQKKIYVDYGGWEYTALTLVSQFVATASISMFSNSDS